jgi:ABC-type sugar transport system permease subunit
MKDRSVLWGYFFIFPNLLFLSLFLIYPLIHTFYLSFQHADIYSSSFAGWDNYREIFKDSLFLKSLVNTFYFVLLIVPATVLISLVLAVLMQGIAPRAKHGFRLVFYLPVVSTPVVLSLVWGWMYNPSNGIINYFTGLLGLGTIDVFSQQTSAILALSLVVITWMIGQPVILYVAAMDGVSKELFEAAFIDGANRLQVFVTITLPMITYTTILILITSTISVFQIFVVVHLLTSGGPYHGTESLVYTIYRTAFIDMSFGKASAQGVVLFLVILVIALLQLKIVKSKTD